MRILKLVLAVSLMFLMIGCTTTNHELSIKGEKFSLNDLNRNEYEVIGTVEGSGSSEGTLILGLFRLGAPSEFYTGVSNESSAANTLAAIPLIGGFLAGDANPVVKEAKSKARWEMLNKATNADAVIVTSSKVDRVDDDFFVASKAKVSATIKGIAIRYKTDSDLGPNYVPPAAK